MKRNLFAAFLAVMLVMALMFVVVPNAKAEDENAVVFEKLQAASGNTTKEITKNTLLDLNGFNVTVNIAENVTLSVIDTGNKTKDGTTAGVLTLADTSAGTLELTAQNPTDLMRYVAIKEGNTYTFHPCNLTFSQAGLNTKAGDNDDQVALCLRATYFGNDKVVSETTEFGICPLIEDENGNLVPDPKQHYSANSAYNFAQNAIVTHAFFNLTGALDKMDDTGVYCAYMVIDGTTVYSSNFSVTPREVLKKINVKNPTPSAAQKEAIEALMRSNTRVNNILSNLRPETAENELIFGADKANRVSLTTEQQVWFANGVTFTNDKAKATTNVADYAAPVRLYKNSTITVEAAGMTKIVFNCNTTAYATSLKESIGTPDGVTVDANGKVVTVTFAAANTFTVTLSDGQVQMDSIVVTSAPSCTHEAHNAKCTVAGTCLDCDEPVAATGHTKATDATCKEPAKCHCGEYMDDQIDENAHNYVEGTCTICGGKEPGAPTEPVTVTVSIADYAAANGWSNGVKYTTLEMDGYITVTAAGKDNTGKYYTSGNEWRTYQTENPSITVTAADGMTIVSVKIIYNVSNTGVLKLNGTNVTSKTEVDIDAASVTFNVGNTGSATNGQVKITAIEVTYMPACEHEGGTATCTEKKVCTKCGNPYGEPLGHSGGTATCKELAECETCHEKYGSYATNHVEGTAATCQAAAICSVCEKPYGNTVSHKYDGNNHTCDYGCGTTTGNCIDDNTDGICDYAGCGKEVEQGGSGEEPETPSEPQTLATFEFGSNGSATHADGSSKTSYTETANGYTLKITSGTNFYTGARDAKGNSCIKLGASSKVGSFSFTVPDDVTSVVIYVAGYKAKTVKITVNGTSYSINTTSDNGAYTAITVDTSNTKTVSFTTTSTGYRAMVNTIEFVG